MTEMLNRVLIAGSSQHGNNWYAPFGWKRVASSHLQISKVSFKEKRKDTVSSVC